MNRSALKGPFPWIVGALALSIVALPWVLGNAYLLRVWMLLLIYALIALGLNLVVGLAGLVSLGQAGLLVLLLLLLVLSWLLLLLMLLLDRKSTRLNSSH